MKLYSLILLILLIGCTTPELGVEISKEKAEDITLQYFRVLFSSEDIKIINSSREDKYWKVNALIGSENEAELFTLEVNAKTKKPEYMTQGDNRIYIEKMVTVRE